MNLIQILGMEWCDPRMTPEIESIQSIVSTIILAIQIAIPVLLIIFGMLDLGKAVVASKEDEIKNGQQLFIKRLISAALVFFVIFIVKVLVNLVASGSSNKIWSCADRFISGAANSKASKQ